MGKMKLGFPSVPGGIFLKRTFPCNLRKGKISSRFGYWIIREVFCQNPSFNSAGFASRLPEILPQWLISSEKQKMEISED